MIDFKPCEIPKNLEHHVYELFSVSTDIVKVGRSNKPARIKALKRMNYGDITDWECFSITPLNTLHATIAVEAMTHSRLIDEGNRIPRFEWTRLPDNKQCFADECFRCSPENATNIVKEMSLFYEKFIAIH